MMGCKQSVYCSRQYHSDFGGVSGTSPQGNGIWECTGFVSTHLAEQIVGIGRKVNVFVHRIGPCWIEEGLSYCTWSTGSCPGGRLGVRHSATAALVACIARRAINLTPRLGGDRSRARCLLGSMTGCELALSSSAWHGYDLRYLRDCMVSSLRKIRQREQSRKGAMNVNGGEDSTAETWTVE